MAVKKASQVATIDVSLVTIKVPDSVDEFALDTASKIDVSATTEDVKPVRLIIKETLLAQKRGSQVLVGHEIKLTDNVFTPELVKAIQGGTIIYGNTAIGTGDSGLTLNTKNAATTATITLVVPSTANSPLTVTVVGNDITVNLATTVSGVSTSTATLVNAAINASVPASALVTSTLAGAGTGVMTATTKVTISTQVTGYTPPVVGIKRTLIPFELTAYSAQYNASGLVLRYEKIVYPNCSGDPIAFSSEDGKFRENEYVVNSLPDTGVAPYLLTYVDTLPVVA